MSASLTVVMMHQGGWDEIAVLLGPVLVIAALAKVARSHAPEQHSGSQPDSTPITSPGDRQPDRHSVGHQ